MVSEDLALRYMQVTKLHAGVVVGLTPVGSTHGGGARSGRLHTWW